MYYAIPTRNKKPGSAGFLAPPLSKGRLINDA